MTYERCSRAVRVVCLAAWLIAVCAMAQASAEDLHVDSRHAPPEWQTAICLPDDPQKTLVDHRGRLLYHFQGGTRFALTLSAKVDEKAEQVDQKLLSPRVPIVQTLRETSDLKILEEAFAVTQPLRPSSGPQSSPNTHRIERLDDGSVLPHWARPAGDVNPLLSTIAVHYNGSIRYAVEVSGGAERQIALALCEGYHDKPGRRVQKLHVEGDDPVKIDTVKHIGKNKAAAFFFHGRDENGDGRIMVEVTPANEASDKNTILNALWAFERGANLDEDALLAGKLDARAIAVKYATSLPVPDVQRNDVLLVSVTNTGSEPKKVEPGIVAEGLLPLRADMERQVLWVSSEEAVFASRGMTEMRESESNGRTVRLEPMTIQPGTTKRFCVTHAIGRPPARSPRTVEEAAEYRKSAIKYWKNEAPLPYGRVSVPDENVQALIDSSIRNIWQAREIKDGLPAFQVGPTVYRGLWIVDGAFILETATMLGAGEEARSGITYMLSHQKEDGSFELITDYHKENGIVLWACTRHARLTRDKKWLRSVWPKLQKTVRYIQHLRDQTLENDTPLDDGLIPPGFPDGGLGGRNRAEYTNVYWNLAGLKAAVRAARWLGREDQASSWKKEYDDFYATFRRAAERDMAEGPEGNSYLPIIMGDPDAELPQKAQWAFCHAVYPGQVFPKDDPLVEGNLDMLEATEREGMVMSTGWMTGGIWNYFASFYGHAWLWQGRGRKAAECLYAMGNHASPLLAWREEQAPQGGKPHIVGDMPHNWASAEFIRLAVHLLALDRGNELHLLEGLPSEWTEPGMVTRLDGVATPFGPLTFELSVDKSGEHAQLEVESLPGDELERIVVHRDGWATGDSGATLSLDPSTSHSIRISIRE